MRGRLVVGLLVLAALAGGCSSSSNGKKGTTTVASGPAVPWTASKPAQVADRAPASRACRAPDLSVGARATFVPNLQGGIALVAIRNTGKQACRLTGRPRVRFVKNGGPRQVQRAIPPTPSNFPEVTYPPSSLLALKPDESAALTITWANWCDPVIPGKPRLPPSALRITLSGGRGRLEMDYNAVPACVDPAQPSTIGVSPFQPNLIRVKPQPWTSAFIRAAIPRQPIRASRGGVLHFRIVLTNASKTAATFTHCPAYIQQLVPSGRVEAYELNCAAAKPIKPGASLAFAMEARVPPDAPLGRNGLFWQLDPFGVAAPSVHARVRITR